MKHIIIMPDLGQTTNEAKILSWLKKPGDKLAMGDPLLEVETDKTTMYVESHAGGYMRKRLANEGDLVPASNPVAILTDTPDEPIEEAAESKPSPAPPPPQPAVPSPGAPGVAAMPAARMLAKELGIDLSEVTGSGRDGLITKGDVEQFASRRRSKEAHPAPFEGRALRAMAALTSQSKATIPHFYVTIDLDVSAAEKWRSEWNRQHPDLTASVNDYLVRAAAAALAESPRLNTRFADGKYEPSTSADVLVVAGLEDGLLLVPVLDPHADGIEAYLARIKAALSAARDGRLQAPAAASMPLLAVSNLGMYGVKEFSAIIPPGSTAILAIGALRKEPVLRNGRRKSASFSTVTVSADHRVVDGIVVARFLERMQVHLDSL